MKEIKRTVLCFLINNDRQELLMIYKRRGQGAGKWNVPGGKVKADEDLSAAAIRECEEETGLCPENLTKIGELEFFFPESNSWNNHCTVFRAYSYSGKLIPETTECSAEWVAINKIPYSKMWDSDQLWAPLVFSGKVFHRIYHFDGADRMKTEKIIL